MNPTFLIVDLFCGAGGTTTGFAQAQIEGNICAKVIACVNHDAKAIKSHWMNHPEVKHFEEDIRTLDLTELVMHTKHYQDMYTDAKLILWASLECTNFSKAKGGLPRDADSRTLADHLERYVIALHPDYIQIENVVEFMSWGPLDDKGKPVSRKNGSDWMRWCKEMCGLGYYNEWKELNSADYGAYTSRNRLFGCFAKPGLAIIWPAATHSKKPSVAGMYGDLKKWKAVKDVLDFTDEGESIFKRAKPLSEKTLERIYAGLLKYIAKGDTAFISKYFSGKPQHKNIPVDGPAGTIMTVDGQALVQPEFLLQTYAANSKGHNTFPVDGPGRTITTRDSTQLVQPVCLLKYDSTDKTGKHYPPSLDNPCPVVIAQGRLGLIQGEFIVQRNSGEPESKLVDVDGPARTLTATGGNQDLVQPEFLMQSSGGIPSSKVSSVDEPSRVITTSPNQAIVQPQFLHAYYGNGDNNSSVDEPAPTIPTKDRCALVQPQYLVNYNHSSNVNDINEVAPTLLTRDKLALVQPEYFIDKHFGAAQNQSIEQPAGTILPTDKHRLVEVEPFIMPTNYKNPAVSIENPCPVITASKKYHYLVNPAWGGNPGSVEEPCCVVVARQDKAPLYFVQVEHGPVSIAVYDNDSECSLKIKQFMAVYGLVDIKMRMLRVNELLKIQGFPATYQLAGNQSDQKKFIGNSVVPHVVKAWCEAMAGELMRTQKQNVA